jgi:DivIVA domain-containing protein
VVANVVECARCGGPVDTAGPAVVRADEGGVAVWRWVPFLEDWRGGDASFAHPACLVEADGVDALVDAVHRRDLVTRAVAGSSASLAERFRTAQFPLAIRGYNVDAVDEWLEDVAVAVSTGGTGAPPARPSFPVTLRGYERRAVDVVVAEAMTLLGGGPLPGFEDATR